MSDPVHVIAIISPAKGQSSRLRNLLEDMIKKVHEREPNTSRYHMHVESQATEQEPAIVMIESYDSQAHREAHNETPHFQELFKTISDEGLVAKEPIIVTCKSAAGFESR